MLDCTLYLSEVPLHLYQITGGFYLLAKQNKIKLTIKRLAADSSDRLPYNMLMTEADGKKIIYDMNDGYDNLFTRGESYVEFYDSLLDRCDCLFKRSFNAEMNSALRTPKKIMMTAPNFLVTVRGNPAHLPSPCDPGREKIKKLVRMLPWTEYYNGYCYENNFCEEPAANENPKALFMARLWDPAGDFPGQLSTEKSEERREINESRAKCIRLCRKELSNGFFGGIAPSEFAAREYPDLVLENASLSKKNKYLEYMKTFDIHISTMGLHRSTGWKFAEYLAASRAIVAEPMFYGNSGGISDGENYFSFGSAQQCVEKITELFDPDRRLRMMRANRDYYEKNMRCDAVVCNTLKAAKLL